ncbi:AraC family transcriptional regulator [Mucilaginibacter sp. L3T2-6]|uniref:helix-turn-helix domain-containing protein n=1 Tax=Mucilaginibacter sp. L3T2-6 TaxID=3062491 RepID=UPI0026768D84|nr:AraC family transcriptional regulator [Mucilaginibacter sp. L3T2-6]MDO3643620.1 AraC family transcriptional regulator [Mucilaginibacter sp. L3T2-6]MDV6216132.1 AraC family transcriptional regulator [Mucilaginibacter sp. L3T2-6]
MTAFRFIPVTPHLLLSPYIAKMYVFESSGRLPELDKKLIVPNANFKLTLTYRNGIAAGIGTNTFVQDENKLSLAGIIDTPVSLDPCDDIQTGTIIIEFNPVGAYRLFRLSYADIKNQIVELGDLLGNYTKELESRLAEINSVTLKLQLLQNFLIKRLEKTTADPIYDYCIDRITAADGIISVAKLEKETGYSSRWLHTKFSEHLGTGPKNLSEIIRFKQVYRAYSAGSDMKGLKTYMYRYYHDQSHFIRAFKRFTGYTPTDLQNSMNELATRHYTS